MKLFYKHLHLFEHLNEVSKINVIDFSPEKEMLDKHLALLLYDNGNGFLHYKMVCADTDLNAIQSFYTDEMLQNYELKYVLRNNQIKDLISGKLNFGLSQFSLNDISNIYNEVLDRDLKNLHEFYTNFVLYTAFDEKNPFPLCFEYERFISRIKKSFLEYNSGESPFDKQFHVEKSLNLLQQMAELFKYYLTHPLSSFPNNMDEIINNITFGRLSNIQKERLKIYYHEKLPEIYDYHINQFKNKAIETQNIIENFIG